MLDVANPEVGTSPKRSMKLRIGFEDVLAGAQNRLLNFDEVAGFRSRVPADPTAWLWSVDASVLQCDPLQKF